MAEERKQPAQLPQTGKEEPEELLEAEGQQQELNNDNLIRVEHSMKRLRCA